MTSSIVPARSLEAAMASVKAGCAGVVGSILLMVGLGAPMAHAVPVDTLRAVADPGSSNGCGPGVLVDATSGPVDTGFVGCSFSFLSTINILERATADYGHLGVFSRNEMLNPAPFFTPSIGPNGAEALFRGNYLFGGPDPTVTTALNVHLDGEISEGCAGGFCSHRLNVFMAVEGIAVLLNFQLVASGVYDLDLTTPEFTVPTGELVSVFGRMQTELGASSDGSGRNISHEVSFGDTLEFNPHGPVFDLPAGFTVSGPCVEDNRFVCGAPTAVPAPATLALLAAGAGLLAWRGRRRGRVARPT
jgi:hypothetical protein